VEHYDIYRCSGCDLEFVYPLPSAEAIAAVYERDYFTGAGFGYADYFAAEHRIALNKARQRIQQLREAGLPEGARTLDVGCADGTFVDYALAQGFDAYGVEVSQDALRHAPEAVRDRIFDSLETAAHKGPFACITFWDVLEHLPDPFAVLRAASALLAPGGLMGVVVPVIDNVNARLVPRSWDQYKPPEHLWYFSRRSLTTVLRREVGTVMLTEGAWRRDSRCIEPLTARSGVACMGTGTRTPAQPKAARVAMLRFAADVERWIVRGLVWTRALPEAWVQDSILALARAEDAPRH
jgi:SAM-dependent methyltransferase